MQPEQHDLHSFFEAVAALQTQYRATRAKLEEERSIHQLLLQQIESAKQKSATTANECAEHEKTLSNIENHILQHKSVLTTRKSANEIAASSNRDITAQIEAITTEIAVERAEYFAFSMSFQQSVERVEKRASRSNSSVELQELEAIVSGLESDANQLRIGVRELTALKSGVERQQALLHTEEQTGEALREQISMLQEQERSLLEEWEAYEQMNNRALTKAIEALGRHREEARYLHDLKLALIAHKQQLQRKEEELQRQLAALEHFHLAVEH